MWLREPINIELTRNSSSPIGLQFWDEDADAPLDISNYTNFTCRVAKEEGGTVVAVFECNIINAETGLLDILFNGTALAGQPGPREIITLAYQVLASSANETFTAMRGSIFLTPGIS